MTIKRPALPDTLGIKDEKVRQILDALIENQEITMGRRGAKVAKLGPSSNLATVISKINELIDSLQS